MTTSAASQPVRWNPIASTAEAQVRVAGMSQVDEGRQRIRIRVLRQGSNRRPCLAVETDQGSQDLDGFMIRDRLAIPRAGSEVGHVSIAKLEAFRSGKGGY